MKEQDDRLTLQETEQLCRLYMDCKLSVFEETELQYVLTQVDYHSPLIDDVRGIMGIDTSLSDKPFVKAGYGRKFMFRKWKVYMSVAASIAIVIGIGLPFWNSTSRGAVESQSYYIAYVDGYRLNDEAARLRVEAEKKSVDDFIKEMSELESNSQQVIDNFFTPNILE